MNEKALLESKAKTSYHLTMEERAVIEEIDANIQTLSARRDGMFALILRQQKLEGNFSYDRGILTKKVSE